ncbi:hypothetical protein Tco_0851327, partial [Tanacetum coccineum]
NMEQLVIIAVSSCRVSKYREYQVFASSTTYYYLNLNIPEAAESRALFKARYQDSPSLIISKFPHQDVQQEKTRNKFPLKMIMEHNPNSYKHHQLRETVILAWITAHSQAPSSGYITDTTATAPITLFSPTADKVADHPCTELVEKYKPADPKKIPPEILAAQGKTGVFQFHLNTLGNLIDLTLDVVFDIKKQDQSTCSSAKEPGKGTPSSTSTATTQSVEKQEETKKGKEKGIAEEEGTTPPSHSIITDATKKEGRNRESTRKISKEGPFQPVIY